MIPNTLFVGLANSAPCWYRCALPAQEIGADWIGAAIPKSLEVEFLYNGSLNEMPNFDDYEVLVLQQVKDAEWNDRIQKAHSNGQKVLYEIDDFVHGIWKIKDHAQRERFYKKVIKSFQHTMGLCDGLIVSTDFLGDQYAKYNENVYVCKNGLDTERYSGIEFPDREGKFVIGWAGGSAHEKAITPWLGEVGKLVRTYKDVYFVSIGMPYGETLNKIYPGKGLTVPWITIENLPYALTNFDCYIAPMHDSKYFKSKSNLRWLEGSAIGLPGVVNPQNYFDAVDNETALYATTPEEAGDCLQELIEDRNLGPKIGKSAQEYVQKHFDVAKTSESWVHAITDISKN